MMTFENYDNHLPPKTDDKPVSKGYFFQLRTEAGYFTKKAIDTEAIKNIQSEYHKPALN